MKKNSIRDQKWYPNAVAICIGILFYFLLTNLSTIWSIIGSVGYFLYPLIAGGILAYLMNPLMRWFEKKPFGKMKSVKVKRILSLVIALLIVYLFIVFVVGMVIPQLVDSVMLLYNNKDSYISTLSGWLGKVGAGSVFKYFENVLSTSQNIIGSVISYISENEEAIQKSITTVGGHLGAWGIGIVFSVYFLAEKDKIAEFGANILKWIQKDDKKRMTFLVHLKKIDTILTKYLVFSIVDGLIIGFVNFIFMMILGMQYSGLVSVIVGITNLIPTFGPIIGTVIGGLILLLVNPMHALYFVIFTLVLQTVDGYILKPKLFGGTFGISGLWILIAIIVGGRIFGILGILLAIPFVAIADYLIKNVYLPFLNAKKTPPEEET